MRITRLFLLILIISTAFPLFGDDGSWSKSFSLEGGSIYSETENEDIALEKELLVFDGDFTTAFFLFRNTTSETVTVTCGFPVMIDFDAYQDGDLLRIPLGKYNPPEASIPGLEYFETETRGNSNAYEPDFSHPEKILINEFNNSREFLKAPARPADIDFTITREGKPVHVDAVLLERRADERGASLTFHYRHDLTFSPGETSVVKVRYSYDMLHGDAGGGMGITDYRWNYIIGTGNTWKGPIGDFYFLRPSDWSGDTPEDLDLIYRDGPVRLYYGRNYEPETGAVFELYGTKESGYAYRRKFNEFERKNFTDPDRIRKPSAPLQPFVRDIDASSSLDQRVDVFTAKGILSGAEFSPLSMFDGIPETAWCEGAPGAGIGEYVSFELTETAWGITVYNGFTRMFFPDDFYISELWEKEYRDPSRGIRDYFSLNNRPKTLAVKDARGRELYTLALRDSREAQIFPGIVLEPGRYRIEITDIYKGSAWDDTCIAETQFLSGGGSETFRRRSFTRMLNDQEIMSWLEEVSF